MHRIERRLLEAVKDAIGKGYAPHRFYLVADDRSELAACRADVDQVDGIEVREAKSATSRLYCRNGASVVVRKRLAGEIAR